MADEEEFEYVDIYEGDRYIGRIGREEYEDALEVAEAIRPWLDKAYAKALAGLEARPGDPLLDNHIAAARETADDG